MAEVCYRDMYCEFWHCLSMGKHKATYKVSMDSLILGFACGKGVKYISKLKNGWKITRLRRKVS